jgi:hypothetical protein
VNASSETLYYLADYRIGHAIVVLDLLFDSRPSQQTEPFLDEQEARTYVGDYVFDVLVAIGVLKQQTLKDFKKGFTGFQADPLVRSPSDLPLGPRYMSNLSIFETDIIHALDRLDAIDQSRAVTHKEIQKWINTEVFAQSHIKRESLSQLEVLGAIHSMIAKDLVMEVRIACPG